MQINDIQFNASLIDILNELVAQLRANGILYLEKMKETSTHVQIQCPYHGEGRERRPSAGIRKSDGVFHCFACGEVHSLPEVVSYCFGKTDDTIGKFGWSWLLKNFATVTIEERKDVDFDLRRDKVDKKDASGNTRFVTEEELDGYRYYHPYWTKRKITDERIIELFDLGYDKETDCITFPVRDENGNCLFVARRSVRTKWFNYPSGVEKPLYGLYELGTLENFPQEIVVCESMLDALTVWEYGGYAIALNGLGSDKQFEALRRLPCRKLILATDNDAKGMEARKVLRSKIKNKIITEYVLPTGKKDMNELSREEFLSLPEIF